MNIESTCDIAFLLAVLMLIGPTKRKPTKRKSSGLTCTSSIEVEGNGFIIYVNINELEDLDNDMKKQMQEAYDSVEDYFDLLLDQMQDEVPEIEYFKIVVCEKDGDPIATIEAED